MIYDLAELLNGGGHGSDIRQIAEVQAYVFAAYRARAQLAKHAGDERGAVAWRKKAKQLKRQFNEQFWLPEQGWYAIGLDKDKRPIDALTSIIEPLMMIVVGAMVGVILIAMYLPMFKMLHLVSNTG